MYNPFKPHIVQFDNNKFAVRKLTYFLIWGYRDNYCHDNYWWTTPNNVQRYSSVNTYEEAVDILKFLSDIKVKKVYV